MLDLPLLGAAARWHVTRILREVAAPDERLLANNAGGTRRIAYKTGTSYGYRDAWSLGYDAEWTVGVWVGRADGTPLPGVHGRAVAAPILFRVFDELPRSTRPTIAPPPDALLAWDRATLPPGLRDLGRGTRDPGPRVLFPLPDTSVLMTGRAIPLEAGGGRPPYTWLIDGAPLATGVTSRGQWQPPGPGFVLATVLDADGRADRVRFRVTGMLAPDAGRLRATP